MKVFENAKYIEDIKRISELPLPWEKLQNKSILISGASGMIGSCFIDVIMQKNPKGMNCKIYALGRDERKASDRFSHYINDELFAFIPYDINKPFVRDDIAAVDYVIHLASNTHPVA